VRFVYKNLTEKYTRILKEEHSEKSSLIRIINDMSLSQEEMYATLLKELIKPETEEDFLISVENLRDVARASYASDARAYARVLNFRTLAADAEKLGYPELANAVDAESLDSKLNEERTTALYEVLVKAQDKKPQDWMYQVTKLLEYVQEQQNVMKAQTQHTSTHGVNLADL